MKTIIHIVSTMSPAAFVKRHGLTLVIKERAGSVLDSGVSRFYAYLDDVEVKEGEHMLSSPSGQGETPEQAAARYWARISEQTLIINAFGSKRCEIKVPRLVIAKSRPKRQTVHILVIDNEDGLDATVHSTRASADAALASYVRDNWRQEVGDVSVPKDDKEAIDIYFHEDVGSDDRAEITECEVCD